MIGSGEGARVAPDPEPIGGSIWRETMAKNEVAIPEKDNTQLPAYLQGGGYKNEDNFDSSDVTLPRVKLLQGISPEVTSFDTAKAGVFWHTGADLALGEKIRFIVCDRRKKYLLSAPLEDGQGVLARADDAKTWDRTGEWSVKQKGVKHPVKWAITDADVLKSGLTEWGTYNPEDSESGPAATLFYDYLVLLPDHLDLGPCVVSLARSSIRTAKKGLNDKISMHGNNGRPMQALVFEASAKDDQSDSGAYKNWLFKGDGFVQDEALFRQALELKGSLALTRIADEADTGEQRAPADDGTGKF